MCTHAYYRSGRHRFDGRSRRLLALAAWITLCCTSGATGAEANEEFLKGGDISLLQRIEDLGGVYRDAGKETDPLVVFASRGCNCMRLRIWNRPSGRGPLVNDLAYTLKLARRIKRAGLKLLLDFHYSDTWADPGHQRKPEAWKDLPLDQLKTSVFEYTRHVIASLERERALPDMVQIGNEITPGMLWDDGRVGGKFDNPQQWARFAALVGEGIRGVRAVPGAEPIKIMIHIDRGGDQRVTRWFFDRLLAQKVDFDVIGLSYYPWWHGSMDALRDNLAATATRYEKEIIVVETGFPWTRKNLDAGNNVFDGDPARMKAAYPPTPGGQKAFLAKLIKVVRQTPGGRGKGVIYWAPEWIAVRGLRSSWENIALFDERGNVLPAMDAFSE